MHLITQLTLSSGIAQRCYSQRSFALSLSLARAHTHTHTKQQHKFLSSRKYLQEDRSLQQWDMFFPKETNHQCGRHQFIDYLDYSLKYNILHLPSGELTLNAGLGNL